MDLYKQFEHDQKMLSEIKSLFEFVSPSDLRRSLIDLLFTHLTSQKHELPDQQELLSHFYYILNFLEEMDKLEGE